MIVRELFARFGIKTDKDSFKQANSSFAKLKNLVVASAAALAVKRTAGAMKEMVDETVRTANSLGILSKRLGVSSAAYQKLSFAAQATGVSQQTFELSFPKLAIRAAQAAKGTGLAVDAYKRLGISLRDASGKVKAADGLFLEIADAMADVTDTGERLDLVWKLLDNEGLALEQTLALGRDGILALGKQAEATGGIIDDSLIASSAKLTLSQQRLAFWFQSIRTQIAKAVIPVFERLTESVRSFIEQHPRLFKMQIPKFFELLARTIGALGNTIAPVIGFVSDHAASLGLLAVALKAARVTFLLLTGALSPLGLALGAAAAAVVLLVDEFTVWSRGGKAVLGPYFDWLEGRLKPIIELLKELAEALNFDGVFDGIFDIDFASVGRFLSENLSAIAQTATEIFLGQFVNLGGGILRAILLGLKAAKFAAGKLGDIGAFFTGSGEGADAASAAFTPSRGVLRSPNILGPSGANIVSEVNVVVNPSAGMDEEALGNAVARKVKQQNDKDLAVALRAVAPALGN